MSTTAGPLPEPLTGSLEPQWTRPPPGPQPQSTISTVELATAEVSIAARALDAPAEAPSFASSLLAGDGAWTSLARRAAVGLGLSSLYGLALGLREGGLSILEHAAGVPLALVAVAALGLPALYIVLALFDAPLSSRDALAAAARGVASAGLSLAGLAPLAALYVIGSESAGAAAIAGTLGLVAGGLLGLRQLVVTLRAALAEAGTSTRALATAAQVGFAIFAVVLASRIWAALLPVLGGAR